jgi:Aldo/keto reductase family
LFIVRDYENNHSVPCHEIFAALNFILNTNNSVSVTSAHLSQYTFALHYKTQKMKYKILGTTGLSVSKMALGTMNYGGRGFFNYMGNLDQDAVDEQIKTVTEAGVNFIDTANIYSEGLSEIMIGRAIKNLSINRDDLVIANTTTRLYRTRL